MKKGCLALLIAAGCFTACKSKEDENATSTSIDQQVDSMVGIRVAEINARAMEDLDRRMSIEVKVKADSMVQAWLKAPTDSATVHH